MKNKIISLLVIISLSFQMTYSQEAPATPEAQKGKLQALYKRFGKAKVDGAVATIKRYGPWAIITNYKKANAAYKQAKKKLNGAKQALEDCKTGHCRQEKAGVDAGLDELRRTPTENNENMYKGLVAKYNSCLKRMESFVCGQEEEARKVAEQNLRKAGGRKEKFFVLFIVGAELGALAVILGAGGTLAYFVDKADQRQRAEEEQLRQRAAEEKSQRQQIEALQEESASLMPELELETQEAIKGLEQLERELGAAGG